MICIKIVNKCKTCCWLLVSSCCSYSLCSAGMVTVCWYLPVSFSQEGCLMTLEDTDWARSRCLPVTSHSFPSSLSPLDTHFPITTMIIIFLNISLTFNEMLNPIAVSSSTVLYFNTEEEWTMNDISFSPWFLFWLNSNWWWCQLKTPSSSLFNYLRLE